MGYASIKVPKEAYEALRKVRAEIARNGAGDLPKELINPTSCPLCSGRVRKSVKFNCFACQNCGYKQPLLDLENGDIFTLGAMVWLGAAALLRASAKKGAGK